MHSIQSSNPAGHPSESAGAHMTRSMVTISFDQPMDDAYLMMQQWGVRHLPVRDVSNKIVGILADSDIYRAMNPLRAAFEVGQTVGDYMSWPAISIEESTPVSEVAEAMITERVSAFIVTKAGEPTGIVTTEDLLRVLQKVLEDSPSRAKEGEPASAAGLSTIASNPVVREAMRELQSVGI